MRSTYITLNDITLHRSAVLYRYSTVHIYKYKYKRDANRPGDR